jgi:hypothetical protein
MFLSAGVARRKYCGAAISPSRRSAGGSIERAFGRFTDSSLATELRVRVKVCNATPTLASRLSAIKTCSLCRDGVLYGCARSGAEFRIPEGGVAAVAAPRSRPLSSRCRPHRGHSSCPEGAVDLRVAGSLGTSLRLGATAGALPCGTFRGYRTGPAASNTLPSDCARVMGRSDTKIIGQDLMF